MKDTDDSDGTNVEKKQSEASKDEAFDPKEEVNGSVGEGA